MYTIELTAEEVGEAWLAISKRSDELADSDMPYSCAEKLASKLWGIMQSFRQEGIITGTPADLARW